jgi:hypothetical protein
MKKTYIILILMVALSSCIVIRIGENNYRDLTVDEKSHVLSFDSTLLSKKVTHSPMYLYEINMENIKSVLKNSKYTWIHHWVPYCSNDFCKNISVFEDISNQHTEIQFIMVSTTYEFKEIEETVERSSFNLPIFVLKDSTYGHKLKKAHAKFENEVKMLPQRINENSYFAGDFLFKNDTLIYTGAGLESKLDSILSFYK